MVARPQRTHPSLPGVNISCQETVPLLGAGRCPESVSWKNEQPRDSEPRGPVPRGRAPACHSKEARAVQPGGLGCNLNGPPRAEIRPRWAEPPGQGQATPGSGHTPRAGIRGHLVEHPLPCALSSYYSPCLSFPLGVSSHLLAWLCRRAHRDPGNCQPSARFDTCSSAKDPPEAASSPAQPSMSPTPVPQSPASVSPPFPKHCVTCHPRRNPPPA